MKTVYDYSSDCWFAEFPCHHRHGHSDSLHALQKVSTSAGSILNISKYRDTCERSISILGGIAIL